MSERRAATVEVLQRWTLFGGHWHSLNISDEHADVELCACTGEPVERLRTTDPDTIRYLQTVIGSSLRDGQPEPCDHE